MNNISSYLGIKGMSINMCTLTLRNILLNVYYDRQVYVCAASVVPVPWRSIKCFKRGVLVTATLGHPHSAAQDSK